ncbi:L-threonine dehydratase biosynthetic IlvA [Agrobacterium tumefaciens]|nr:L-threonine dehydratase biosynthetic IlvA [Agrobacterium tumefaciens]
MPPFDHEDIIEGQATVAAEIMDQLPEGTKPDIVVMPVGGGGLSAGLTGFLAGTVRKENFVFCEPEVHRA